MDFDEGKGVPIMKTYEEVQMEIVLFKAEDIVTGSIDEGEGGGT